MLDVIVFAVVVVVVEVVGVVAVVFVVLEGVVAPVGAIIDDALLDEEFNNTIDNNGDNLPVW